MCRYFLRPSRRVCSRKINWQEVLGKKKLTVCNKREITRTPTRETVVHNSRSRQSARASQQLPLCLTTNSTRRLERRTVVPFAQSLFCIIWFVLYSLNIGACTYERRRAARGVASTGDAPVTTEARGGPWCAVSGDTVVAKGRGVTHSRALTTYALTGFHWTGLSLCPPRFLQLYPLRLPRRRHPPPTTRPCCTRDLDRDDLLIVVADRARTVERSL